MSNSLDVAINLLQNVGYGCPYEYGKRCIGDKNNNDSLLCKRNGKKCWKKYIQNEVEKK